MRFYNPRWSSRLCFSLLLLAKCVICSQIGFSRVPKILKVHRVRYSDEPRPHDLTHYAGEAKDVIGLAVVNIPATKKFTQGVALYETPSDLQVSPRKCIGDPKVIVTFGAFDGVYFVNLKELGLMGRYQCYDFYDIKLNKLGLKPTGTEMAERRLPQGGGGNLDTSIENLIFVPNSQGGYREYAKVEDGPISDNTYDQKFIQKYIGNRFPFKNGVSPQQKFLTTWANSILQEWTGEELEIMENQNTKGTQTDVREFIDYMLEQPTGNDVSLEVGGTSNRKAEQQGEFLMPPAVNAARRRAPMGTTPRTRKQLEDETDWLSEMIKAAPDSKCDDRILSENKASCKTTKYGNYDAPSEPKIFKTDDLRESENRVALGEVQRDLLGSLDEMTARLPGIRGASFSTSKSGIVDLSQQLEPRFGDLGPRNRKKASTAVSVGRSRAQNYKVDTTGYAEEGEEQQDQLSTDDIYIPQKF